MSMLLIWTCIITPLEISFRFEHYWFKINKYVVDCLFLVDVVVTFFTGYIDEEFALVDDHSIIAYDYLRGWFFIDIIAIVPIDDFM